MLQHGREIAPSVSWEILAHVKRTGGISVNELATLLKMSYMGVKQHCDALKRRGYLDTWRRPKTTGRPEKIFRPTVKLDLVLPNWGNEMCLNMLAFSAQMQGENAPERLLHSFLQQKAELWAAKIKAKAPAERAQQFAKLRNSDGWMCEVIQDENGISIAEYHSPLKEIARIYPAVWTLETRALERCFDGEISRVDVDGVSHLQVWKNSDPTTTTDVATESPLMESTAGADTSSNEPQPQVIEHHQQPVESPVPAAPVQEAPVMQSFLLDSEEDESPAQDAATGKAPVDTTTPPHSPADSKEPTPPAQRREPRELLFDLD